MTEDANNKIQSVFESKIEEALKTKRKQNTLELSCLTLCLSSIYHHEHTNTNIEGLYYSSCGDGDNSNTNSILQHYIILWNGPSAL